MKMNIRCLMFLVTLVLLPCLVQAAGVKVSWQANTEADLAGYRVYYGQASGAYVEEIEAGMSITVDIAGLDEGTRYYFAVTAYDDSGNESGYSAEESVFIPEEWGGASDRDRDGLPDAVETSWGLDPDNPRDAFGDGDHDGVCAFSEYQSGTDPADPADYPVEDAFVHDLIGETGGEVDLSAINPDARHAIVPLDDDSPSYDASDNMIVPEYPGLFFYAQRDVDTGEVIALVRLSVAEALHVTGDVPRDETVSIEDNLYDVLVAIPSGAVRVAVRIGIGVSEIWGAMFQGLAVPEDGQSFDILPYGLSLAEPATISIPFVGDAAEVRRYDYLTETWVIIDDVQIDEGMASFQTRELGHFVIAETADEVTPPVAGDADGGGGGCFVGAGGR